MCTVTAVLLPAPRALAEPPVLRVLCNRDEKRSRAEALPPIRGRFGDRTAIFPIDPSSRGTWIGVNDAGLVLCLLNASPSHLSLPARVLRSRGGIIPSLLDCHSLVEAIKRAKLINPREFPPFRLLGICRGRAAVVAGDGSTIRTQNAFALTEPFMLTSSGLGDALVEAPRRQLFRDLLGSPHDLAAAQHRFHTHQWPDQTHLSVNMSRADARTVSRTMIEVGSDYARMTYRSVPDSRPVPDEAVQSDPSFAAPATLALRAGAVA